MNRKLVSIAIVAAFGTLILTIFSSSTGNPRDAQFSPYIREFDLPIPNSAPIGITVDAKGDVWVVATTSRKVLRFNPTLKTFSEFRIPDKFALGSEVWGIAAGKDGRIWFTSAADNSVWSFNPGDITFKQYPIPTPGSFPLQVAVDARGDVWFTELFGGNLGRIIASSGEIVEYQSPSTNPGLAGLFIAADGTVWIAESLANKITRFNPETRSFTEYVLAQPISSPTGIGLDLRGNVWFVEHGGSLFGKFNPLENLFKRYATSAWVTDWRDYPASLPYWIAIDSSGKIWFNEHTGNRVATFNPSTEVLVEYELPTGGRSGHGTVRRIVNALQFALAPDGRVWFTEWTENKIGMIDTSRPLPFSLSVDSRVLSGLPGGRMSLKAFISGSSSLPISMNATGSFSFTGRLSKFLSAEVQFSPSQLSLVKEDKHKSELFIKLADRLAPSNYSITASASDGLLVYSVMIDLEVKGEVNDTKSLS